MSKKFEAPTQAQVLKFLRSLGRSADEIAKTLEGLDVKAVCGDAHKCAIAQALTNEFGATPEYQWQVGSEVELARRELVKPMFGGGKAYRRWAGSKMYVRNLPRAVDTFITRFDEHEYPQLETKASLKVSLDF